MTSRSEQLREMAAACEKAEGPSSELDTAIWLACAATDWDREAIEEGRLSFGDVEARFRASRLMDGKAYTSSIDAALTLVAGIGVLITLSEIKGDGMPLCVVGNPETAELFEGVANTMPLAACAAALRSQSTQEGAEQ